MEEGVEEHGDAVGGEGADDLFEVVDGDLVGIAIGEFGERGKDPRLELHHGQMRRKRRRGGLGSGGLGGGFGKL